VPALFAHADGDDFIMPEHSRLLQRAYAGDNNFISFEGDHNSQVAANTAAIAFRCSAANPLQRPQFFYTSVGIFFHATLTPRALYPAHPAPNLPSSSPGAAAASPSPGPPCLELPRPVLPRTPSLARDPNAWGEMSALQMSTEEDEAQLALALSNSLFHTSAASPPT
jgi:hypothetical protein